MSNERIDREAMGLCELLGIAATALNRNGSGNESLLAAIHDVLEGKCSAYKAVARLHGLTEGHA